jgi:hypothetical protein
MFKYAIALFSFAATALADCTPQAEGQCIFYFGYVQGTLADIEYQCGIYNNNCDGLSEFDDCEPGMDISGLPTPVHVDGRGGDGDSAYVDFTYDGIPYGLGNNHQDEDCSSGLSSCHNYYIEFAC